MHCLEVIIARNEAAANKEKNKNASQRNVAQHPVVADSAVGKGVCVQEQRHHHNSDCCED